MNPTVGNVAMLAAINAHAGVRRAKRRRNARNQRRR